MNKPTSSSTSLKKEAARLRRQIADLEALLSAHAAEADPMMNQVAELYSQLDKIQEKMPSELVFMVTIKNPKLDVAKEQVPTARNGVDAIKYIVRHQIQTSYIMQSVCSAVQIKKI